MIIDFSIPDELAWLQPRVRTFVAEQAIPLENDARQGARGPEEGLCRELIERARGKTAVAARRRRIRWPRPLAPGPRGRVRGRRLFGRALQGSAASADAIETGKRARPMAEAGWRQVTAY